jgi:hypothetical protein
MPKLRLTPAQAAVSDVAPTAASKEVDFDAFHKRLATDAGVEFIAQPAATSQYHSPN